MVARTVIARDDDIAIAAMLDHALDRERVELWSVREHDERCLDVVAEHGKTAAKRCTRATSPVVAMYDSRADVAELVRAFDDDDVANRRFRQALEHRRQEHALLRRAVACRRARREHDCRDQLETVACSISTVVVGSCEFGLPSLPIRSTTSSPRVTVPMMA